MRHRSIFRDLNKHKRKIWELPWTERFSLWKWQTVPHKKLMWLQKTYGLLLRCHMYRCLVNFCEWNASISRGIHVIGNYLHEAEGIPHAGFTTASSWPNLLGLKETCQFWYTFMVYYCLFGALKKKSPSTFIVWKRAAEIFYQTSLFMLHGCKQIRFAKYKVSIFWICISVKIPF